jgi:hypothetical protein
MVNKEVLLKKKKHLVKVEMVAGFFLRVGYQNDKSKFDIKLSRYRIAMELCN